MDEEKTQHKALNYILHQTPLRAFAEPELAHMKWNVLKNTLAATGMDLTAMKLTIACALDVFGG